MGPPRRDPQEGQSPRRAPRVSARHRPFRLVAQCAAQSNQGQRLQARRDREESAQRRPRPAGAGAPRGLRPPAQGRPVCGPTLGARRWPAQPQRGCVRRDTSCLNRYPPFISIWCFPPRIASRSCRLQKSGRKCTPISEVYPNHWIARQSLSEASKIMCIFSAGWLAASHNPIG